MAVASEIGHIGGAETEEKAKEARRWTCVLEVGLHGGGDVAQTLERVEAAASRRRPPEQGLHGRSLGLKGEFPPSSKQFGGEGAAWWGLCFASEVDDESSC